MGAKSSALRNFFLGIGQEKSLINKLCWIAFEIMFLTTLQIYDNVKFRNIHHKSKYFTGFSYELHTT